MDESETIALDSIQAIAARFGASFDAEKIVDTVVDEKDGTQYYKVRWVKYSWEPAASFAHLEHLIRDFWSQFGGIPESIQDFTASKNDPNRQASKQLTAQVIVRGHGESNQQNDISSSILTPVSAIGDSVTNNSAEGDSHLQIAGTTSQIPSNTEAGSSTNNNIISPVQVQQVTLPTQELSKPTQVPQDDLPLVSSTSKQSGSKKNRVPGEPKKRRKIPGNCNICGKHFKSTTNIAAHKKLHTEERQHECNECGRKFRRKLHLVRHKESHAGIKSYVCNICGNYFSSKWYMQAHAVIHSGERPYKCDICEKCFNNKANLNKHKLIHENNRPFACNECGRTYRQSYDLKRHMSTHSVEKNFSCTYCDRSFAMKSYLQRHLLTHVGDKKFSCEMCSAKFFQRGHLNFHIKQHHGKNKVAVEGNISETNFGIDQSEEEHVSKENVSENGREDLQDQTNEIVDQNEFFSSHNDNARSIVFLAANDSGFTGGTPQVVPSKQIYQETFTNSQHNISIAVNNSIPQKCLIIDANHLVEKRGVILEGCEDNQICIDNPDENNSICLDNGNENKVHTNNDLVAMRHDLEREQREENISHNSVGLESIRQASEDVALSVLTSDHGENYFTEHGVLELQKDSHIYLQ